MSATSGFSSWWSSPPVSAALEISAERVAGLVLSAGRTVQSHAIELLPGGAVVPSLTSANIVQGDVVRQAVGRVLDALGRPRRVALIVPDAVVRLSIVRLEQVPDKVDERDQLIRFNVRKAAPFPLDAAVVSITDGQALASGAREFVVAVARRDIIEEYEETCAAARAGAGIVDAAACGTINLALAGRAAEAGDWMLVHVAGDASTIAIMRRGAAIFFRVIAPDTDEGLADAIYQSAMYHVDRLDGQGLARVVVADRVRRQDVIGSVRRAFDGRSDVRIEAVGFDGTITFGDRITAGADVVGALASAAGTLLAQA